MYSCEMWCCRRALPIPWTYGNTNTRILEQIKPETLLEAKMTKLKLSYFGHIMRRQGYLEKTVILGRNRRQQRERKIKYEMVWLHTGSHRRESTGAEQGY